MTAGRAGWGYKMTATLLVVVPIVLLLLIGSFCFVGCTFDTHGLGLGFVQYSDLDIIPNSDCVAYWPLNDSPFQNTALDVVGKAHGDPHNGTYKNVSTNPGLFACPGYVLNATIPITTPAATGTQTIGAPGIVTGDTVPPHDPKNPISATCMDTDGGFVSVPANSTCNPPVFSLECWVRPGWNEGDPAASRSIFDARHQVGTDRFGYSLLVSDAGKWTAFIFLGGATPLLTVTASKVDFTAATHLVLTFDGANAAIFVNGTQAATGSLPPGAVFTPNTAGRLAIGAGFPYLADRTPGQTEPPPLFPVLPFKGKIQDVAIYKAVLSDTTIMNHSEHGKGNATG